MNKASRIAMSSVLALTSLLVTSPSPLAAAEDLPANAALKYWQAFAAMPRLVGDKTGERVWDASTDAGIVQPVDEELAEFLQSWQCTWALRLLHRGAKLQHCDWGLDVEEDGINVLLPHPGKARHLMRISLLSARYNFEQGRQSEGIDDVIATIRLGRHVGRDGVTISILAGYSIEHVANFVVAAYLPQMDTKALASLEAELDRLPPLTPIHESIQNERYYLEWFVDRYEQADDNGRSKLCHDITDSEEAAKTLLEADIAKLAAELRPVYDQLPQLMSLPMEEFNTVVKQRVEPAVEANPLGKVLFASITAAREAEAVQHCRHALLRAAVDVVKRGKDAVRDHPDPFGQGPFQYMPFDGGFELRSQWQYAPKKWLSLTVGIPRP